MTTKTSSTTSSSSSCEHNALIRRQFMKIEALESELAYLRLERDSLLGENERLQFQLECAQTSSTERHSIKDLKEEEEKPKENSLSVELSQQLIDRRVDALERKYGGIRARLSAIVIQRAFRTYRLKKRFQRIAFEALKQNEISNSNQNSIQSFIQIKSSKDDTNDTQLNERQHLVHESLVSCVPQQQQHECERKRRYRVGLNLLNKRAERGISFLQRHGFLETHSSIERQSQSIARFLLTRKGVSKAVIGDYLSSLDSFCEKVLLSFCRELDFSSLPIDSALRKFQTFFRFPGEAQKIERLVEAFATRYTECNQELELSRDSVFILAFAIIMLNTDLHSPTNARNRMSSQQWLQNLSRVFTEEKHFSEEFLLDIYQRIKSQELRTGADHVTQVAKVQSAIIAGKSRSLVPNLCLESRRLVCYCRLYEVRDLNSKKDSKERHQREVFLFNDLLLVTKLSARAKNQMPEYVFRLQLNLEGLSVFLFETHFHRFGIDIRRRLDDKRVLCFNARNSLDQKRFAEDLKESIAETDEMENLRITKTSSLMALNEETSSLTTNQSSNQTSSSSSSSSAVNLGQNSTQNRRKSSSGSLDSGLSLPSRDHSPQTSQQTTTTTATTTTTTVMSIPKKESINK